MTTTPLTHLSQAGQEAVAKNAQGRNVYNTLRAEVMRITLRVANETETSADLWVLSGLAADMAITID